MASVQTVERDGRNAYLVRWRTPEGASRKKVFSKKSDAERHRTAVEHALHSGAYADAAAGRLTLGEWSSRWMAGRVHLTPKTIAGYESLLRARVIPVWGPVQLGRITRAAVVAWVADMRAQGLSASRTRQAYHLLTSMLDAAVKETLLVRNPAAGVDLPRLRSKERRYLGHQQVAELADAAGQYRALVLVLSYCGLRWGEATALRLRNVDLLRGRVDVVESVVEVSGALVFGAPKSHQQRSVGVPKFLRDELVEQMAGRPPGDLLFPSPNGAVLRVSNFRRRGFDLAAASIGLQGLTPHELRHTAASLAIASGASVKAVQRALGHASATLTLDRYGHLFADELDTVADALDSAVRKNRVSPACPAPTVAAIDDHRNAV